MRTRTRTPGRSAERAPTVSTSSRSAAGSCEGRRVRALPALAHNARRVSASLPTCAQRRPLSGDRHRSGIASERMSTPETLGLALADAPDPHLARLQLSRVGERAPAREILE